jgi:hypothetical protein
MKDPVLIFASKMIKMAGLPVLNMSCCKVFFSKMFPKLLSFTYPFTMASCAPQLYLPNGSVQINFSAIVYPSSSVILHRFFYPPTSSRKVMAKLHALESLRYVSVSQHHSRPPFPIVRFQ